MKKIYIMLTITSLLCLCACSKKRSVLKLEMPNEYQVTTYKSLVEPPHYQLERPEFAQKQKAYERLKKENKKLAKTRKNDQQSTDQDGPKLSDGADEFIPIDHRQEQSMKEYMEKELNTEGRGTTIIDNGINNY